MSNKIDRLSAWTRFVYFLTLFSAASDKSPIVRRIDPPTTAEMIAAEINSRIESYQKMEKKVTVLEKELEKVAQQNEVLEQRLNNFILEEHVSQSEKFLRNLS